MKLAPTLTLLMLASAPAFSFTASVDFNDLATGDLKGKASGTGFETDSVWSSNSAAVDVATGDLSAPASTNYGLSQSTGVGPRHVFANVSSATPYAVSANRQNGRNLESTITSGTVWISFLAAAPTGSNTSWAGVGLDPSEAFSGFSNSPLIGIDSDGNVFYSQSGFNLDTGTFVSGVATTDGSANLVLLSVNLDAGELNVWVNPDVDDLGVADLTSTDLGTIASSGISRIGVGGVNSGQIDAVYLSNDVNAYQQVTGSTIPEPATWAAMAGALALVMTALRRRRR